MLDGKLIVIELSKEDALLFKAFQENYQVVAPIVGFMDSLKMADLKNMTIQMDIDKNGVINHSSITRHYRA